MNIGLVLSCGRSSATSVRPKGLWSDEGIRHRWKAGSLQRTDSQVRWTCQARIASNYAVDIFSCYLKVAKCLQVGLSSLASHLNSDGLNAKHWIHWILQELFILACTLISTMIVGWSWERVNAVSRFFQVWCISALPHLKLSDTVVENMDHSKIYLLKTWKLYIFYVCSKQIIFFHSFHSMAIWNHEVDRIPTIFTILGKTFPCWHTSSRNDTIASRGISTLKGANLNLVMFWHCNIREDETLISKTTLDNIWSSKIQWTCYTALLNCWNNMKG